MKTTVELGSDTKQWDNVGVNTEAGFAHVVTSDNLTIQVEKCGSLLNVITILK